MATIEGEGEEGNKVISPIRRTAEDLTEKANLLKAFTSEDHGNLLRKSRGTLYLEEEKFVNKFLRCLICRELLDGDSKSPKILPCHHSICIKCILKQFHAEYQYRLSLTPEIKPSLITIVCPTCQKYFVTAEEGLLQLPTDHRIIQLIDFARHTNVQTVQYCLKHKTQALNFFCERCAAYVCRDCTIVDHKEAYGHRVIDLDVALKLYTPVIDKVMAEMETNKTNLNERKAAVGQVIETMEKSEQELISQIHSTFGKLRAALEEREKELVDMAESNVGSEKGKLKEKKDLLDSLTKELESKQASLKSVKESGNIEELHKTHEEVKNYKFQEAFHIPELDDGVKTNFVFNDKDEKYLSGRIKSFGEVYTQVESTKVRSARTTSSTTSIGSSTLGSSSYNSSKYLPSSYRSYSPSSYGSYSGYSTRSFYRP